MGIANDDSRTLFVVACTGLGWDCVIAAIWGVLGHAMFDPASQQPRRWLRRCRCLGTTPVNNTNPLRLLRDVLRTLSNTDEVEQNRQARAIFTGFVWLGFARIIREAAEPIAGCVKNEYGRYFIGASGGEAIEVCFARRLINSTSTALTIASMHSAIGVQEAVTYKMRFQRYGMRISSQQKTCSASLVSSVSSHSFHSKDMGCSRRCQGSFLRFMQSASRCTC